ncbi:hypothetical protein BROUX41_001324 [Berkeleyomyces rouxiae]|uniref:uncharacterized protein n=1 Tax=Berkeleyomyces rouxiae TaxID=2035830 RepID=UPI003B82ABAE
MPPKLAFSPPILNSASPWATDLSCLEPLYASPSTGAITTRTCTLDGFSHDDNAHRYLFFSPSSPGQHTGSLSASSPILPFPPSAPSATSASLNTLGYSPHPLETYLSYIRSLVETCAPATKPIILSVTGTPADIHARYTALHALQTELGTRAPPLALEINLSCPNICGAPPPAYDAAALQGYLAALPAPPALPVGIKTPPYTHAGQFAMLRDALRAADAGAKLAFVTATNTLGGCVALDAGGESVLGPMAGGMAGPPLHLLALGNVQAIRALLDADPELSGIDVIGVGGVSDVEGYRRMRAAGARFVAMATAVGQRGIAVFDDIASEISYSN